MPRDLPGLYWDEEKKRYFPTSSRPAGTAPNPSVPTKQASESQNRRLRGRMSQTRDSNPTPSLKRQHVLHEDDENEDEPQSFPSKPWRAFNSLRESPGISMDRRRCIHGVQMQQISSSTRALAETETSTTSIHFDGPVTALCAKGDAKMLVGDTTGWLYAVGMDDPDSTGLREFGLRTQITSITRSGPVCMVSSLGSPACLLVTRDDSTRVWVLRQLPPQVCGDVWCGQISGRKAIVGGTKALVCFSDVERDEYIRLHRSSDVLAMCQKDEEITFMGMRNGIIERWDSREPGGKTDLIVNMSSKAFEREDTISRAAASVDYLRVVRDWQLLVRTMRGDLETHDLRYLRNDGPLLQFQGHVPSYESKLGLVVDPGQDFLFAGGGNSFLRVWSLRTGQPLPAHPLCFPSPIRAMEIVQDVQDSFLWVAIGNELGRFRLGPRGVLM